MGVRNKMRNSDLRFGFGHAAAAIRLIDVPTSLGPVSLSVHIVEDGRSGLIRVNPPERESVEKVVIHLEHFERSIRSVRKEKMEILDRSVATDAGKEILLMLDFE